VNSQRWRSGVCVPRQLEESLGRNHGSAFASQDQKQSKLLRPQRKVVVAYHRAKLVWVDLYVSNLDQRARWHPCSASNCCVQARRKLVLVERRFDVIVSAGFQSFDTRIDVTIDAAIRTEHNNWQLTPASDAATDRDGVQNRQTRANDQNIWHKSMKLSHCRWPIVNPLHQVFPGP